MLDFLYADHERVASFVSQIEGVGNLVGYERNYEKERTDEGKLKASIPIVSGEKARSVSYNRNLRQEYDPLWINSKKLVEAVAENSNNSENNFDYGKLGSGLIRATT